MKDLVLSIIRKYFKLFLSIVLVSSLGCTIMTGLSSGHKSLVDTLNNYVEDGHYPEAIITTEVVNNKVKDRIRKLSEVEKVESRLTGDTFVVSPAGRLLSCSVFSFRSDDLQKFYYWDSIYPDTDEYVYIDYELAEGNNIKAGDRVEVRINDEYRRYQVAGIISAPQTLAIETHGNKWSTNSDFGYIFAPEALLVKETENRKAEAKAELDKKKELQEQNEKKMLETINKTAAQLKIARIEVATGQQLYSSFSGSAKEIKEELIVSRNKLLSYVKEIKQQRNQLEKTRLELIALLADAKSALADLDELNKALEEIDKLEKQFEEIQREILNSETSSFLTLLGQLGEYRLDELFNTVSIFNNVLSYAQSLGFGYDISELVDSIVDSLTGYIDGVRSDLDYLSINDEQMYSLIERIYEGEEGIQDTPEYRKLFNTLRKYQPDVSFENIIEVYYTEYEDLYAFIEYVDGSHINEMLSVIRSFGSSVSLSEMLGRIKKIEELIPLLSKYSEIQIVTTHDLVAAFENVSAKIETAKEQIAAQKHAIIDELAKQGISIGGIPSLIIELEETIVSSEIYVKEIDFAISEIDMGLSEIDEYLSFVEETLKSIEEVFDSVGDQLNSAQAQVNGMLNDLNLVRADYLKQFADLRMEIEKAYLDLEKSEGYEDLTNQFMVYFKDGSDPDVAIRKIRQILNEESEVKNSYIYEDSPVKARIDANIEPLETMSYFVPIVFFGIVLIVVFLFMSLIIRQCRREIGILRALGFEQSKVVGIFCLINLVGSLIAAVLGLIMGKISSLIVGNIYATFFPLPVFDYEMDLGMFFLSVILTVIVGQIATILSAVPIASISPSEAMSRDISDNKEIPETLQTMVSRSSPINKFSVTSLMRNPLKFFFSVICIAATIVLIFVSMSIFASTDYLLGSYYGRQITYDVEIFFMNRPDEEYIRKLEALDYVDDVEKVSYYYADLVTEENKKSAVIKAVEKDSDLIAVFDSKGNKLDLNDEGLIIDKTLSDKLGVDKGEKIWIDGLAYTVDDVAVQTLNFYNYLTFKSADKLKDPDLYTLICRVDPEKQEELLNYLVDNEDYLYSVFTSVSESTLERALRIYDDVVIMIIGFAMVIGLIIILNTAMTNLLENRRELSVLRTLGFQHSEISRSWFRQSLLFFICSCAIGIPAGIWITLICLDKLSTDGRLYMFVSGAKEYLVTIILVFAYICLAHLLTMNSFRKWDYIEIVKDKE
ncbi:MAG: FtsX-like permease family protein [Erysipelotrichaceae bacterium]|nr:FtsX-like permease family protein [Erysipelotrichaceae bacterium]